MDHGAMEDSMDGSTESMTPEAETETGEGAMDHGSMDDAHAAEMAGDEHEPMMVEVAPEIVAAVEALPIDDLHNMDDELSLGTIDPEYMTAIAALRDRACGHQLARILDGDDHPIGRNPCPVAADIGSRRRSSSRSDLVAGTRSCPQTGDACRSPALANPEWAG